MGSELSKKDLPTSDELEIIGKKSKKNDGDFIDPRVEADVISTGSYMIDDMLGGGIRSGSYTEFYGAPSTGKTYFCYNIAREAQKKWNKPTLWLDYESSWDWERAEQLGVNVDQVKVSKPKTQEDGYNLMMDGVYQNLYSAIIVDSATMMLPSEMVSKDLDDSGKFIGRQAAKHTAALRQINPYLENKSDIVVVFTSQIRDNIGVQFGPKFRVPGGHGIQHQMHYRIGLSQRSSGKRIEVPVYDAAKGTMEKAPVVGNHVLIATLAKSKYGGDVGNKREVIFSYAISNPDGEVGIRFADDARAFLSQMGLVSKPTQAHYQLKGVDGKINGSAKLDEWFSNPENMPVIEGLLTEGLKIAEERRRAAGTQMVS